MRHIIGLEGSTWIGESKRSLAAMMSPGLEDTVTLPYRVTVGPEQLCLRFPKLTDTDVRKRSSCSCVCAPGGAAIACCLALF